MVSPQRSQNYRSLVFSPAMKDGTAKRYRTRFLVRRPTHAGLFELATLYRRWVYSLYVVLFYLV
jgi:hypothetical protein